ncbi:uncharacterized protein LOC120698939 isoform X9 [Panicum virgatum]|uniref:uncharacterized protein LOC120698939 isoform X9 n=1 Tax=Panicum virgatum TaxID=38727 RepID=UPI0019D52E77|nr:uncharacterized protein LOC120698939 isoform X9 [Panicum virgatum]
MKRRLDPAGIRRGECWNRRSDASGVGFESSGAGSESDRGNCEDQGQRISAQPVLLGGSRNTGVIHFQRVHSEDLIRTPTSSIAGRGVVRKGSK